MRSTSPRCRQQDGRPMCRWYDAAFWKYCLESSSSWITVDQRYNCLNDSVTCNGIHVKRDTFSLADVSKVII